MPTIHPDLRFQSAYDHPTAPRSAEELNPR